MNVSQFQTKKAAIFHLKKRYAFSGYGHYLFFVVSVTTYLAIKKNIQKLNYFFVAFILFYATASEQAHSTDKTLI